MIRSIINFLQTLFSVVCTNVKIITRTIFLNQSFLHTRKIIFTISNAETIILRGRKKKNVFREFEFFPLLSVFAFRDTLFVTVMNIFLARRMMEYRYRSYYFLNRSRKRKHFFSSPFFLSRVSKITFS